jgi:hypothetical protein
VAALGCAALVQLLVLPAARATRVPAGVDVRPEPAAR